MRQKLTGAGQAGEITPAMVEAGVAALQGWYEGSAWWDIGAREVFGAMLAQAPLGFGVKLQKGRRKSA
jgi:hypothetical protein